MDNKEFDNKNQTTDDVTPTSSESNDELIASIINAKNKVSQKKVEEIPEPEHTETKNKIVSHKSAPRKKKRKNSKKAAFGLILFSVIVIIACICAFVIIKVGMEITGLGREFDNEVIIEIPNGATSSDIAEILKENQVINDTFLFRVMSSRQNADSYKAGKHKITANMSYSDLIETLQEDPIQEKISVDVTFPEGYTLEQCAKVLENAGVCMADDFIEAFNNADLGYNFEKQVEDRETKQYKMEGYCFPDTYTFFKDSEPEAVAQKIYANFAEKVNANMLGRMKELNITIDDAMALASIVQAEAPNSREMKKVSSVFWNRINNPEEFPKLQSDPTKKYAAAVGNDLYDTYASNGLPPGAICNPGIDAINAVLYPDDTDYYYFCSNLSTQEFYYATTLSQHERNLAEAGLI